VSSARFESLTFKFEFKNLSLENASSSQVGTEFFVFVTVQLGEKMAIL
jgi:hypothetical protein